MHYSTMMKKALWLGFSLLFFAHFAFGQYTDTTRVAIHTTGDYYEMENGFLGVKIPKSSLFNPDAPSLVPAPIRSVFYRDGNESNDHPNFLISETPATSMTVTVLTNTTDTGRIVVHYTFDKPLLSQNNITVEEAGAGYYTVTFLMVLGEKACMVKEESDYEVGYEMKVSDNLSPDRGRYEGHVASSIANGYDKDSLRYDRFNHAGWQATVDLKFQNRKDFELLSRWNPFVSNSGWHWQLYNSTAGPTANVFGIFDGRASLLLGTQTNGAGIYTEPSAINDLHSDCDTDGNCHYVWRTENEIWYKKLNADGTSSTPELVGTDVLHPFIFFYGTTVNIAAVDPQLPANSRIKLFKKVGAANFVTSTITLPDATMSDYFVYGVSTDVQDFLLFRGIHAEGTGLLLYAANTGTTNFIYKDWLLDQSINRGINKPDLKKQPNGDITVAYTALTSYQSYNVILNGESIFSTNDGLPIQPIQITFGMAVDPRTGDFFWVNVNGSINYQDMVGDTSMQAWSSSINAVTNYNTNLKPNRRSFTTDDDGNGFAAHEDRFYWFNNTAHVWSLLNDNSVPTLWDSIAYAQVHFNPSADLFYIVGKYKGKLARFSYNGAGLPVFVEFDDTTERQTAGVRSYHKRIAPTGQYFPDIRFEWGIFVGKKNTVDFPPVDAVQTVAKTMNRLSGLANRIYDYANEPLDLSMSVQEGGIYLSALEMQAVMNKVKNDNDFYNIIKNIDPLFIDVMGAWRDPTTAQTQVVYQEIVAYANGLKEALTVGSGIQHPNFRYTTGGNSMRRFITKGAGLMADTKLTLAERDSLKKIIALFARVLWDDDFVPLFVEHGLNFGTASVAQIYTAYRWYFAILAAPDPEFAARAAFVPTSLQMVIDAQLNASGAAQATPHYIQPPMDLVAFTALQLQNEGLDDKFIAGGQLAQFTDFFLHLQTPPSVRFANNRKLISFGDGSEESAALTGLLGTGFAESDTMLSQHLMYAYRHGPMRGSDFDFVTMSVDFNLPDDDGFVVSTGNFPGYLSTMRSAEGTDHESALWFINGDWYNDHRNDDRGAMAIYALGAPLSLNYGTFYSPFVSGAHTKSTPVLESQFWDWTGPYQPFELPGNASWYSSHQDDYLAFKNSAFSSATFTRTEDWQRKVYMFGARETTPIFVIEDDMEDNNQSYIWSFNFMDTVGFAKINNTLVTPPVKTWNYQGGPYEYPQASSPGVALNAGLNKIEFKGKPWVAHPTGGIDWEVYEESPMIGNANLANWAHAFIPTVELDEYKATNNVLTYSERQSILRVQGKDKFYTVIVPFYKEQRPANLTVSKTNDVLTVTCDDFDFETNLQYMTYHDDDKDILTTYAAQPLTFASATIEDGPMELEIRADTIFARLHGPSGARLVTLPSGVWTINRYSENATFSAVTGKWSLGHTFVDSLHNSFVGGFTEYIFVKAIRVSPKVFLQGPYNSGAGTMTDNLRSGGLIPLTEPYSGMSGFTHLGDGGGEKTWASVLAVTGDDAIVDWVFLELRDKTTPATKIATRTALVQRDGDVVDLDGTSPVDFTGVAVDDYYLAVRHRNHLGCRTADVVNLTNATTGIDFTNNLSVAYKPVDHPNEALASIGGGKFGLWGGNANGDGFVKMTGAFITNNDYLKLLNILGGSVNSIFSTYSQQDLNMDGHVKMTGAFITNNDYLKLLNILGGSVNIKVQTF